MIDDAALLARAEALVRAYAASSRRIATAESCTGGLVAGLLTAVPGSSAVLERGFVTYSNEAKTDLVGVADRPDRRTRRSERAGGPRHGGGGARSLARGRGGLDHRHRRTRRRQPEQARRPRAFRPRRHGGATRHIERRFGDLGRAEIRRLSVEQALALLEGAF